MNEDMIINCLPYEVIPVLTCTVDSIPAIPSVACAVETTNRIGTSGIFMAVVSFLIALINIYDITQELYSSRTVHVRILLLTIAIEFIVV